MCRKCVFCDIQNSEIKERVVFENEQLYVIEDIRPCSAVHFLVLSKEHILDCNALSPADLPLLYAFEEAGMKVLEEHGVCGKMRLGFHGRPWHSVSHLHLHCIGLPFKNCWSKLSHSPPFLVSLYQVREVLERRVKEK